MPLSEKSEELAAELHGLYRAGAVSLPLIANQFIDANGKVNQSQSKSEEAFTQINGEVSQVYESWAEMRNKLQTYLGKSGEHTHNVAESLIEVMNNYRETDEAASKELDRLMEDNDGFEGDLTNPDDIPDYKDPEFPK